MLQLMPLAVALASFSLTKMFHVGTAEMSASIIIGTFLMIPASLFWDHIVGKVFDFT